MRVALAAAWIFSVGCTSNPIVDGESGLALAEIPGGRFQMGSSSRTTTAFATGPSITTDQANVNGAFPYDGVPGRDRGAKGRDGSFAAEAGTSMPTAPAARFATITRRSTAASVSDSASPRTGAEATIYS
jgi:hypothetical protein